MKTNIHLWQYLSQFLLGWEMFQTKVVEEIKAYIFLSVNFPWKSFRLWDNVEKLSRRITGTLHEDQYTFLLISLSFLLRMRNVSNKSCRGNQNTHFVFNTFFFFLFSKILPFYEIMQKAFVEAGQATGKKWRMCIACWIPKATNTHLAYVIHMAFHCRNGCTNSSRFYYVTRALPVLFLPKNKFYAPELKRCKFQNWNTVSTIIWMVKI